MIYKKYFGTDGIRARYGNACMTPSFLMILGYALGQVYQTDKSGGSIFIGQDTRASSDVLSSALMTGLMSAGINVRYLGVLTTPAVAFLVQKHDVYGGIMISASHNPHYDNGIKIFNAQGEKLSDEMELKIEALIDQGLQQGIQTWHLAHYTYETELVDQYIDYCQEVWLSLHSSSGLCASQSLKNKCVVLDCAHGAGSHIAGILFRALGASVIEIASAPDGVNINANCGATALLGLQKAVMREKADFGIALDGDGDRLMLVDSAGIVLDGDDILYHLALASDCQVVIGTLMTNFEIESLLKQAGIRLIRAKVGDRYVLEQLKLHDARLGGEASGHIIIKDFISTGDGLIAAMCFLSALDQLGIQISEIKHKYTKTPQWMKNIPLTRKFTKADQAAVQSEIDAVAFKLGKEGRVLVRPSGTEPLVRVMVEAHDSEFGKQAMNVLADKIQQYFNV